MKAYILIALCLVAGIAHSQSTTTCSTYGAITSCNTDSPNQYDSLRDAGKRDFDRAAQALGDAAAKIAASKTIVKAIMMVTCNHAMNMLRVYADGHTDVTDLGSADISAEEMRQAKVAYPNLEIVSTCNH